MPAKRSFIICATDFSPRSRQAAEFAARLARHRSQDLELVHVTDSSRSAVEAATRQLEAGVTALRRTGATVESRLIQQRSHAAGLLEYIQQANPALVVVGSGVKAPLDRWALGSFAEEIAETSPVPTLVVRNSARLEAWDWTKDRLRILLALDLFSSSDVVLRWANDFQRAGPCDFIACHINPRRPTGEESGVWEQENPAPLQERLERDLRKKVRDQMGMDDATIIVRPFFGDPGPRIVEIAEETKAHLIAVGAHQRRGLRRLASFSVSRDILHSAATNIVCIPVTAKFDPREVRIPDYRRVLVATDFSDVGNAGVPFACAACHPEGVLRLVHVVKRGRRSVNAAELRRSLRALIPSEWDTRSRTPPEVALLEATDPATGICDDADAFGADLVCLASHGAGGSRALHGSVAKEVLKRIRRPLLVIRRPDE